jgi:hypothetical protein
MPNFECRMKGRPIPPFSFGIGHSAFGISTYSSFAFSGDTLPVTVEPSGTMLCRGSTA